jgi:hypothetical protein
MLRSCFLLFIATPLIAADITLQPGGDLRATQMAARAASKPVRVIVKEGRYALNEPLVFTAEDSGVSWEAEGKAVITGGREITGWTKADGALWKASVPWATERPFEQLWVNGRLVTLARSPNKGFFHITQATGPDVFPGVKDTAFVAFDIRPAEYAMLKAIPAEERAQALLTVTHAWAVSQTRIQDLADDTQSVLIVGKSRYPFVQFEPDQRWWVEGFRSALDAPGEWYLDRAKGELLYHPQPGEDMEKAEVVAPQTDHFMKLNGVKDATFTGLSFQYGRHLYPAEGKHDGQAAASVDAMVQITDSTRVHFVNCEIAHVGRHALQFRHGCSHSSVKHCHFHDLGGGGVYVGVTSVPPQERVNHDIVVEDCILQHGGRLHPAACGVVLTHTQRCKVSHCDIGDFYYTGVSAGWNWGYGESLSRETLVENCHIHHLGWAYLSDMGGYYGLSSSPGTIIRGNHVHHIASHRYGGWGLYNDEGSSDTLMENNLVHDTSNSGFHQHYGYANRVRNNIFAFGKSAQIQRSRNEPHLTFIYERNIVTWDPPTPLLDGGEWNWKLFDKPERGDPKDSVILRRNLYWPTDGKVPALLTATHFTWDEWQKMGRDAGSKFEDPRFENAGQRDFRLKSDSPALKMGFKPWDLTLAGVLKQDAAWVKLAERGHDYPTWDAEAKPWPAPGYAIPLQDFESAAVGSISVRNGSCSLKPEEKTGGADISVVEGKSSIIPIPNKLQGKRCLRVQDAPGLTPSWEPVLDINSGWKTGTLSMAFDLMLEEGATGFFENRAGVSGEFAAGPIISWDKGRIDAGKNPVKRLTSLPAGKWLRIEITARIATSSYTVRLTQEDGSTQEFRDLPLKPTWIQGGYTLFSSGAQNKTAYYIDNLRLSRSD